MVLTSASSGVSGRRISSRSTGTSGPAGSQIPRWKANAPYCSGLADRDAPRLLAAAERYGNGGRPLPKAAALEAAARQFVTAGDLGQARRGWASLTPAELQIAALVEEGLSNPAIAGRLVLSRRTVATHVSSILKKLDVHSRTEIARESVLRTITPR